MQLLLLKLEVSLIGSTCIYQGEELGLEDVQDIPIEKMKDQWGIEFAPEFLGRDTCRTPMVWDSTLPNCGFSTANNQTQPLDPYIIRKLSKRRFYWYQNLQILKKLPLGGYHPPSMRYTLQVKGIPRFAHKPCGRPL